MRRRTFLRVMAAGGAAVAQSGWMKGSARAARRTIDPRRSLYGRWVVRDGLPAFTYDLDQDAEPLAEWNPFLSPPTRRNWLMVGNRAIRLPGAHHEFPFHERSDMPPCEVVDHIQAELLAAHPLLDQRRLFGPRCSHAGRQGARVPADRERIG